MAALHTEILKNDTLHNFYQLYPEKFNNKTNGITFRRWLLYSNPELSDFISSLIGEEWKKDASHLQKLDRPEFSKTPKTLSRLLDIKDLKKRQLAQYLQENCHLTVNPDSIFDIQVKRLHEYKRQQMNLLYLIHKYLEIRKGNFPLPPLPPFSVQRRLPAYTIAKDIIHAILCLQQIIQEDPGSVHG